MRTRLPILQQHWTTPAQDTNYRESFCLCVAKLAFLLSKQCHPRYEGKHRFNRCYLAGTKPHIWLTFMDHHTPISQREKQPNNHPYLQGNPFTTCAFSITVKVISINHLLFYRRCIFSLKSDNANLYLSGFL